MINRKIKNATPTVYDGIKFRSKTECEAYKILKESGFSPLYEAEKVILFKGFKPSKCWYKDGEPIVTRTGKFPKIMDWIYTPDFKFELNGYTIYIEMKGFPNDVYPYKRKMFLKHIEDKPALFFEVKDTKGLMATIKRLKDANTFIENKSEQ